MRLVTLGLLALALMTAGCIGMADEATDTPTSQGSDEPAAQEGQSASKPASDTEEGPSDQTERTDEERSGSVTSIGLGPAGAANTQGDNQQTFTVENGTQLLQLNLTTDGGELDMFVGEPGCQANTGCEEEVPTEDGEVQVEVDDPAEGEWRLRFFAQDPGLAQVDYTVTIGQVVLVQA